MLAFYSTISNFFFKVFLCVGLIKGASTGDSPVISRKDPEIDRRQEKVKR
jgi:hypothetical protein